jgi:histidinol-phosphate aminotransferase
LTALRNQGIKLRDTTSFGLSGQVRLSVKPPAAQDALREAWLNIIKNTTKDMA